MLYLQTSVMLNKLRILYVIFFCKIEQCLFTFCLRKDNIYKMGSATVVEKYIHYIIRQKMYDICLYRSLENLFWKFTHSSKGLTR